MEITLLLEFTDRQQLRDWLHENHASAKECWVVMIRLYCRKKEGNKELCDKCREFEVYAHKRLSACKYGEQKTSCKKCYS